MIMNSKRARVMSPEDLENKKVKKRRIANDILIDMLSRLNLENKKMTTKKKGVMIADDILIDILSRLPGPSLARFRYASKQWLSLSRDPTLINLHLHRARASVPRHLVTLSQQHDDRRALVTSLDCTGRRDSDLPLTVDMAGDDHCQMSPSCNGLVCIHSRGAARLLNPTTGELLLLPAPTPAYYFTCLLGFAQATGQYKILRFYQQYEGLSACEVLTVGCGNGGWRQIRGGGDYAFPVPREGATINGIIYFTRTRGRFVEIVSFDVEDEEFSTETLPRVRTHHGDRMKLFESEERLFLWQYVTGPIAIQIWELHQDGCWRPRCWLVNVVQSRPLMFHGKEVLLVERVGNGNQLYYHMAWESGELDEEYEDRVIMEGKHLLDARTIIQSIVSLASL